jgi:hypothetical protein
MTYFRADISGFIIKPKSSGSKEGGTVISDSAKAAGTVISPPKASDTGFSKWSISSKLSFESRAANPLDIRNALLINTQVKANLTPKWSGTYMINFDVLEQKITDQRVRLTRDLHCWTLSLDWRPGYSIFLSLNAKSNLLKDFKMLQKKSYYR